jgi:hypothetical protein
LDVVVRLLPETAVIHFAVKRAKYDTHIIIPLNAKSAATPLAKSETMTLQDVQQIVLI